MKLKLGLCLLFSSLWIIRCDAADPEIAARQTAQQLTRDLMRLEPRHYLRVARREDLEDDLFAVQIKIKGKIRKAAYFFEITETGFEVVSPDEVLFHSSVDGERRWIVAVETEGGRAYPLFGFPDAFREFNALVRRADVRVATETDARRYTTLYFLAALGPTLGRSFRSSADLRCQIAESLGDNDSRAAVWMRGVPRGLTYGLDVRKQNSVYAISTTTIQLPAEGTPALQQVTFTIQPDGIVTPPTTSTTYSPAGSRRTGEVRR